MRDDNACQIRMVSDETVTRPQQALPVLEGDIVARDRLIPDRDDVCECMHVCEFFDKLISLQHDAVGDVIQDIKGIGTD